MPPSWKERLSWAVAHARPASTYLPAVLITAWIAYKSVSGILERVGHPAVPLDDAFIHFQYARNLAHGHFFDYAPGQGYVAGFTSLLWPLAFVPFYWLGLDGLSIVWVAWVYGFASFAALQVETYRLAEKLTGRSVAISAAAMCALFGAFIWFAGSGMETMTLSWILLRTARLATEWCEAPAVGRTRRLRNELLVFGVLAPLVRPEGAIASAFAAAALIGFPDPAMTRRWRARTIGAAPLLGNLVLPLMHLVMTGSASSNTTTVKWLPVNPYYSTGPLLDQLGTNLKVFFSTLLNGEQWSAVYLPEGSQPFALMALFAIPIAGWRAGKPWRALYVLAVALCILVPCTYHTFLWNRLRYLWPFAPAWFIGAACLARLVGEALGLLRPRWSVVSPVIGGVIAGSLLGNFKWTSSDLAKSAAAIDGQQVALGLWARDNLPEDAVIGVSDTGAIAYFSERTTFDVIGLTTQGEAPHWVAGAGSRFEHYERLHAETPDRFPTHFIVYPHWMQCSVVLGKRLHEESVYDQTILGGTTMVAYEARTDLLGSGARPIQQKTEGQVIDELDVADLVSEKLHDYEIEHGAGLDASNKVHSEYAFPSFDPDRPADEWDEAADEVVERGERLWADGGRFYRSADRFVALLRPGVPAVGIARWVGPDDAEVELVVESGSRVLATTRIGSYQVREVAFRIPADVARERTPIQVRVLGGGSFGSLHYWFTVP